MEYTLEMRRSGYQGAIETAKADDFADRSYAHIAAFDRALVGLQTNVRYSSCTFSIEY